MANNPVKQTFDLKASTLYAVSIEWDGEQPPTRYYRRLEKLGLKVRGDKDETPLERRGAFGRRAGEDYSAVVYQEGFILTSSYSLARSVQMYAIRHGATNAHIGEFTIKDRFTDSHKDEQRIKKLESVYGRRGKPPAKKEWAVTCHECLSVTNQEEATVTRCTKCGGLNVHARAGKALVWFDPGGNVVEAWLRCRFGGPHFEPSMISTQGGAEPPPLELLNGLDSDAWIAMEDSPLLDQVEKMDRETAFLFLDSVFVNLNHATEEDKLERRIKAAVKYYALGGKQVIDMQGQGKPDLFAAAGPLQPDYVAVSALALLDNQA